MLGIENFMGKFKQYSVLIAFVSFLIGAVLAGVTVGSKAVKEHQDNGIKSNIETSDDSLDENTIFYSKIDHENKKTDKRVKALEGDIAKLQRKLKEEKKHHQSTINSLKEQFHEGEQEQKNANARLNDQLNQFGGSLQSVVAAIKSDQTKQTQAAQKSGGGNTIHQSNAQYQPVYDNQEELVSVTLGGAVDRFNTPENTIPANSFVKAILLNGVDSSTSEKEGKNPKPILMEIIDVADLPNGFGSNIKGCRINGIVEADESSERLGIRLRDLTCIDKETKQITVSAAEGYVSGEDGRFGVRGTVVRRDGYLMRNAFIGGALGGVGKAVSQLSSPATSFNPFTGNVNSNRGSLDILKQAGGEGAGTGFDRIAKHYIDEADKLSPVIQVASGRIVDVIFQRSTSFTEVNNPKIAKSNHSNATEPTRIITQAKDMGKQVREAEKFAQRILGERG